ncbi:hypothetical protein BOX15_Mlig029466g1, partial [Macrostomum lignano]
HMGSLLSTSSSPRAQTEQSWATFPPKTGVLFTGHFYLGGDKFESVARESFIFGEPADLQFVNSQPLPYQLPVGRPAGHSRPLQAVVSLRKETARFVKADSGAEPLPHQSFHVELVLDCLVDCEVSVWLFVRQSFNGQRLVLEAQHPLYPGPERQRFSRGLGWVFSCTELTLRPTVFDDASDSCQDAFPLAVLCESLESGPANQQLLLCSAERLAADSAYSLKVLKQITVIDGLPLVVHDIYGISDREGGGSGSQAAAPAAADSLMDPGDADCVVCMVKARDTVILPCRHLCLCDSCADSLRYQASCCPICRAPFRALLQLTVQAGGGADQAAVPILEFVTAQRQPESSASVSAGASSSSTSGAQAASARRPATAQQAWASPDKQAAQPPQLPAARRDSDSSNSSGEVDDRHCWADSESDEPSAAAADAATADPGDSAVIAFPMAELDRSAAAAATAGLLLVDGDADRGSSSCCSSTESANSQRQLLAAAAAPGEPAADSGSAGSAIIIAGRGGDDESDESDFS